MTTKHPTNSSVPKTYQQYRPTDQAVLRLSLAFELLGEGWHSTSAISGVLKVKKLNNTLRSTLTHLVSEGLLMLREVSSSETALLNKFEYQATYEFFIYAKSIRGDANLLSVAPSISNKTAVLNFWLEGRKYKVESRPTRVTVTLVATRDKALDQMQSISLGKAYYAEANVFEEGTWDLTILLELVALYEQIRASK